jgi:hypothetical protein
MIVTLPVGPDGTLNVSLPLNKSDANKLATISIETADDVFVPTTKFPDRESWKNFVASVSGSITDPTFCHHPQGPPDDRDLIP